MVYSTVWIAFISRLIIQKETDVEMILSADLSTKVSRALVHGMEVNARLNKVKEYDKLIGLSKH